jgi:hypothetical protein
MPMYAVTSAGGELLVLPSFVEKISGSEARSPHPRYLQQLHSLAHLLPPHVCAPRTLETAIKNPHTATMAENEGPRRDNGSDNRDRKRKWEKDGGPGKRSSRARGGRSLQHGSRPDKKRNTGRTEHK